MSEKRMGVPVDGIYAGCGQHRGFEGEKSPRKRGQRNWWCKGCRSFVMGPGSKVEALSYERP